MSDYNEKLDLIFNLKNTPKSSQESYKRRLLVFVNYIEAQGLNIEQITDDHVQQFILHLKKDKKLSAGTINNYNSAIKCLYTHVLDREWNSRLLPRMKTERKLPVVPSKEDVFKLLGSAENPKYKAILSLIYGSGLRVSEAAALKISDICSKTMRVRIDNAKHGTTRYSILSEDTLQILRSYFRKDFSSGKYTVDDWLFPGQKEGEHINVKSIKNTIIKLRDKLELDKGISAHTLRHAFATHLIEDGVPLVYVQQLLGHKNISTTAKYTYMTSKSLMGIKSPLDTGRNN